MDCSQLTASVLSYGSSPQGPGLKAGMATSWWWKEEVEVKQPSWHWNRVGAGRGRQAEPGSAGRLEEEPGLAGWLEELQELHILEGPW